MIVYASKNFITKLKCSISLSKHKPTEIGVFDGWTADTLQVSKVELVAVMMHDGSLGTVIVPLRGIRTFEDFVPVFLKKLNQLLRSFGGAVIKGNREVLVLRRTNRPLIGSLHDAKKLIEADIIEQLDSGKPIHWDEAADCINQTPFSVIDDRTPAQALAGLVANCLSEKIGQPGRRSGRRRSRACSGSFWLSCSSASGCCGSD